MGRAKENFHDVNFKTESGGWLPWGSYLNALRCIFWNLMDSHVFVLESPKCQYEIEAKGKTCYLVETNRNTGVVHRYEIVNIPYERLRHKITRKH